LIDGITALRSHLPQPEQGQVSILKYFLEKDHNEWSGRRWFDVTTEMMSPGCMDLIKY
jgi:hypothetical protein